MTAARPAPRVGSVHPDARGHDRALRVSWHEEYDGGLVVLSIWRDNVCTGTVRLAAEDVPDLIATLERAVWPHSVTAQRPPLLA